MTKPEFLNELAQTLRHQVDENDNFIFVSDALTRIAANNLMFSESLVAIFSSSF